VTTTNQHPSTPAATSPVFNITLPKLIPFVRRFMVEPLQVVNAYTTDAPFSHLNLPLGMARIFIVADAELTRKLLRSNNAQQTTDALVPSLRTPIFVQNPEEALLGPNSILANASAAGERTRDIRAYVRNAVLEDFGPAATSEFGQYERSADKFFTKYRLEERLDAGEAIEMISILVEFMLHKAHDDLFEGSQQYTSDDLIRTYKYTHRVIGKLFQYALPYSALPQKTADVVVRQLDKAVIQERQQVFDVLTRYIQHVLQNPASAQSFMDRFTLGFPLATPGQPTEREIGEIIGNIIDLIYAYLSTTADTTALLLHEYLTSTDEDAAKLREALRSYPGTGQAGMRVLQDWMHSTIENATPMIMRSVFAPLSLEGLNVKKGDFIIFNLDEARRRGNSANTAKSLGSIAVRSFMGGGGDTTCPGLNHAVEVIAGIMRKLAHYEHERGVRCSVQNSERRTGTPTRGYAKLVVIKSQKQL
jgi:hypothetical protein